MTREKKRILNNVTIEEAQEASARFAHLQTRLSVIEAQMNERINKIRDEYYEEIVQINEEKEEEFEVLQVFGQEQKDHWGKRKSFELFHSIIGFRTGTPKVTKDKKFTWEGITELVKEKFPSFVRTKTELDKEAIIAMRDDDVFLKLRKACYVDVVQEESFYVEAKHEELQRA